MIKFVIFFLIVIFNYKYAFSRNIGETEITTEDGIEVFQEEKYYLLKKNVKIISDEFELNGNLVKIFFEKDLYDIQELIASTDVDFKSSAYNIEGKGETLKFNIQSEEINVTGEKSRLFDASVAVGQSSQVGKYLILSCGFHMLKLCGSKKER